MPSHPGYPLTPAGNGNRGGSGHPPTTPPLPCYPAGVLNPVDWIDAGGRIGAQQSALMRGRPAPYSWFQRKQVPQQPTLGQPAPFYIQSRPYSRGAGAYSPHFGTINYNPIGAGVVSSYKLPVIAGPGARYLYGAIWFDVQSVPTSIQMNPTIPIETVNALLATASVGPSYLTTG